MAECPNLVLGNSNVMHVESEDTKLEIQFVKPSQGTSGMELQIHGKSVNLIPEPEESRSETVKGKEKGEEAQIARKGVKVRQLKEFVIISTREMDIADLEIIANFPTMVVLVARAEIGIPTTIAKATKEVEKAKAR